MINFGAQIGIGENETTEYKYAFNQETVESVCAFANRRGGTNVDDLLNNRYLSTLRNKAIANHFHQLGEIEKFGSGVTRVIRLFCEAGLEAPKYETVSGGIKVTVFARKGKNKVADKVADKFPAKNKILEILEKNPGCKVGDIMMRTGFSDSYVRKILAGLCKSCKVERRGSRKTGGFYLVSAPDLRGNHET